MGIQAAEVEARVLDELKAILLLVVPVIYSLLFNVRYTASPDLAPVAPADGTVAASAG